MVRFPTTSWSMVVSAGGETSVEHRDSLARLCQAYWRPVYGYVAGCKSSPKRPLSPSSTSMPFPLTEPSS